MGRGKWDRSGSNPRPVERVELNERHPLLRLALVGLLLAIGIGCLIWGLNSALTVTVGAEEIETSGTEADCSAAFTVIYELGKATANRAAVRQMTNIYTEEAELCYRLFHAYTAFEETENLYTVNHSPNTVLEVDPVLYDAFALMEAMGGRALYLGPIYEYSENLFGSGYDTDAAVYDPTRSPDTAAYYAELLPFIQDENAVTLTLLGDHRVRLDISEEYLAYGRENGIEVYVGFGPYTNAFIADAIVAAFTEGGYPDVTVRSGDGFLRSGGTQGKAYTLSLYGRRKGSSVTAAEISFTGPFAAATYLGYPVETEPEAYAYTYEDGETVTMYVDAADACAKRAVPFLTVYTRTGTDTALAAAGNFTGGAKSASGDGYSCAALALKAAPLYIADTWDSAAALALRSEGIFAAWCGEDTLLYTEEDLTLENLYTAGEFAFSARLAR